MSRTLPVIIICIFFFASCIPYASVPSAFPACVPVSSDMAMKATEVSVIEYMHFILANDCDPSLFPDDNALPTPWYRQLFADLRSQGKAWHLERPRDYHSPKKGSLYDSLNRLYGYEPFVSPITGITYEQAMLYCRWYEKTINPKLHKDQQVHISLPSVELYRRLLTPIDSVNHKHHFPAFNYKGAAAAMPVSQRSTLKSLTMRVDACWSSPEGLYTLRGNAAEMTDTKGIAMGGSFRQYAFECSAGYQQTYSQPADWLGFRYVVTKK